MKTKVFKLEIMVIDFDELGAEGIRDTLENARYPNHCISPSVESIDCREVDWSDDHPLNHSNTSAATFAELFGESVDTEGKT